MLYMIIEHFRDGDALPVYHASSKAPPHLTVEVSEVAEVYARALERRLHIAYPLTDEPWGVRRFFVVDPNGVVLNIMSHGRRIASA